MSTDSSAHQNLLGNRGGGEGWILKEATINVPSGVWGDVKGSFHPVFPFLDSVCTVYMQQQDLFGPDDLFPLFRQ